MHATNISRWQHSHDFCPDSTAAEKSTRRVLVLTAAMMLGEIVFGLKFHSMALFADGLHMGTHVTAFLIAVLAYFFARRHSSDARFSFGTGKFGVLGAFTSAIILGAIALVMMAESVGRFFHPLPILFNDAIAVASLGFAVNVLSAWMLKDRPHPGHSHDHQAHSHAPGASPSHHDLNLRAAYIHVIADAITSILAVTALLCGKFFGWYWMDSIMGVAGSIVVGQWAWSLIRKTGVILLDKEPVGSDLNHEIRKAIEHDETQIADLHIWQVGVNKFAAVISLVTQLPEAPSFYKKLLQEHEELVHVTVEVNHWETGVVALAC